MGNRLRASAGFLALFFLFFLCAVPASAQFTLVTGTITDSNGLAYSCGTISATLVNNNGIAATINGLPFSSSTSPVKLGCPTDPTTSRTPGFFTMSLADNTVIKCGIAPCGIQTTWQFVVNSTGIAPPLGTGPQTCTATVTISGASQTVSGNFSCPALSSSGNGGVGAGASPVMGFYLSSSCPVANTGSCFFTNANTQQLNTCTYTNASATVTCGFALNNVTAAIASNVATYSFSTTIPSNWAIGNSITVTGFQAPDTFFNQTCTLTAIASQSVSCALTHANASSTTLFGLVTNTSAGPFVSTDVGKRLFGYGNCQADQLVSSNTVLTTSALTIQTFVSSTQVTLSGTAGASSGAGTGCVIWGTPDDTAAAALDLALLSAPQCPRLHFAAAYYLFTVPHFFKQPNACKELSTLALAPLAANIVYAAGFELDGRGTGTTQWFLTPGFPEVGTCTNGLSLHGCFVIQVEGKWKDIMISGGGNYTAPNMGSSPNIVEMDGPAMLENFTCVNFDANLGGAVGLALYQWAQVNNYNNSACGDFGLATESQAAAVVFRASIENSKDIAYNIGSLSNYAGFNANQFNKYNFTCYDCWGLNQGLLGSIMAIMRVNGGKAVKLYNFRFSPYFGLTIPAIGIQTLNGAGALIDVENSYIDMTAGGSASATGNIGISCQNACTVISKNNTIKGTASGAAYSDVTGSKFLSQGGNILGVMSPNAGSLLELNPTDDLSGASGFTPTCAMTTGGGTGPACTLVAGSTNEKGTIRMTPGTTPGATGTTTLTFVGTFSFTTTPTCTFGYANTGTGTWSLTTTTPIVMTTRSSTAPVFNWNQTGPLTAASTYDIDYSCAVR